MEPVNNILCESQLSLHSGVGEVAPTLTMLPSASLSAFPAFYQPEGVSTDLVSHATLQLIQAAFSPRLNILLFLASLLRYATLHPETTIQHSLFRITRDSQDEAIILIPSEEALASSEGWQWCPETTHKIILVLEALGILRRVFHRTCTEIHVFLGEREISLPDLLAALQALHDKRKNKKVKQIARKAIKRLKTGEFLARIPQAPRIASSLHLVSQVLSLVLREHGVGEKHAKSDLLDQASEMIAHLLQPDTYLYPTGGRWSLSLGEVLALSSARGDKDLTDSARANPKECHADRQDTASRSESADGRAAGRRRSSPVPKARSCTAQTGEFVVSETCSSGTDVQSHREHLHTSELVPDSLVNAEALPDQLTQNAPPMSSRSLEDIQAEATYLWMQLYSEEQREAPRGDRFIGGFITRLQERPDLVRASMVNVLLQRVFPDKKYGPPNGRGSQWFYRSYKGYLAGSLSLTPEIGSWVDSPLSYKQIETALEAERDRQKRELAELKLVSPWCADELVRPFASAVDLYGSPHLSLQEEEAEDLGTEGEEEPLCADGLSQETEVLPYPPHSSRWTPGVVLSLFAYYRGYELEGEWLAYAERCAWSLVHGGQETGGQVFCRFEVEHTLQHYLDHPEEWKDVRADWDGETGIPDIWFIAAIVGEAWPYILAHLLETARYVEIEGDIIPFERYQKLYEAGQQIAWEEEQGMVLSPEYLQQIATTELEPFVQQKADDWRESVAETSDLEWTQEAARGLCSSLAEALGSYYSVVLAPTQDRASLLVYSKRGQKTILTLTKQADVDRLLEILHTQRASVDGGAEL